jgi:hypothetical protein
MTTLPWACPFYRYRIAPTETDQFAVLRAGHLPDDPAAAVLRTSDSRSAARPWFMERLRPFVQASRGMSTRRFELSSARIDLCASLGDSTIPDRNVRRARRSPSLLLEIRDRTSSTLAGASAVRRPAFGRHSEAASRRVARYGSTRTPAELGLPFTSWSVRTLTEYCTEHHLIPEFCDEWVRRVLRRLPLTAQRIRTWKHSSDPLFRPKGGASAPSTSTARRARRSSASTSGARSSVVR